MQVKMKTGDINKGRLQLSLSEAESGIKNARLIADYYMIGKGNYAIHICITEIDSEDYITLFEGDVKCLYSQLEQYIKDYVEAYKSKKLLKAKFKEYVKLHDIKEKIIVDESDSIATFDNTDHKSEMVINMDCISRLIKTAAGHKRSNMFIRSTVLLKFYEEEEDIGIVLDGQANHIEKLLSKIANNEKIEYSTRETFDEKCTDIIIEFENEGEMIEVLLRIKNGYRIYRKMLEEWILNHAKSNSCNTDANVYGFRDSEIKAMSWIGRM